MDSDITGHIIILALLILGSAYFSATETAFSSFNRIRMKNMASDGNKRARLVLKLADNYDQLIAAILIGNNIVNIAASSLATVLFVNHFGGRSSPHTNFGVDRVTGHTFNGFIVVYNECGDAFCTHTFFGYSI